MPNYHYGQTSTTNLVGLHPKLIYLAYEVLEVTLLDIGIHSGVRTYEEQKEYFRLGSTWTLDSKHRLRRFKGIAVPVGGALDYHVYAGSNQHFNPDALARVYEESWKPISEKLKIPIIWGGNWRGKKRDGVHIELAEKSTLFESLEPSKDGFQSVKRLTNLQVLRLP